MSNKLRTATKLSFNLRSRKGEEIRTKVRNKKEAKRKPYLSPSEQERIREQALEEVRYGVDLSSREKLQSNLVVSNLSDYPLEVSIEVRFEERGKLLDLTLETGNQGNGWILVPGNKNKARQFAYPASEMLLPFALLGKKKSVDDLSEEELMEIYDKLWETDRIDAYFRIYSVPHIVSVSESYKPYCSNEMSEFTNRLKPIKWSFDTDKMIWRDPQNTPDYNIGL